MKNAFSLTVLLFSGLSSIVAQTVITKRVYDVESAYPVINTNYFFLNWLYSAFARLKPMLSDFHPVNDAATRSATGGSVNSLLHSLKK